jgi:hypothetical protein
MMRTRSSPSDLTRAMMSPLCNAELRSIAQQAEVSPARLLLFLDGGLELTAPEMKRLGDQVLVGRYFMKAEKAA